MATGVGLVLQGMLLQLELPAEVKPSRSSARRSNASGRLVITMPKEDVDDGNFDLTLSRCWTSRHSNASAAYSLKLHTSVG